MGTGWITTNLKPTDHQVQSPEEHGTMIITSKEYQVFPEVYQILLAEVWANTILMSVGAE